MIRGTQLSTRGILATGALLGYLAASDTLNPFPAAQAAPRPADEVDGAVSAEACTDGPACCSEGLGKGTLLAPATPTAGGAAAGARASGELGVRPRRARGHIRPDSSGDSVQCPCGMRVTASFLLGS
jgi:hypothetical protein